MLCQQGSFVRAVRSDNACRLVLIVMVISTMGCSGTGGAVVAPTVDPVAAADKAMEQYDTDSDGALSTEELQACPGILVALPRYDTNRDSKVDRDELVTRLTSLYSSGVGLTSVNCAVTTRGNPVPSATVRFIPEAFLGEAIQQAEGLTDPTGSASMAIPDEKLPANQQGLHMMQVGIYRVEIEPYVGQLAKSKQPLGYEVDPMSRAGGGAFFDITTR